MVLFSLSLLFICRMAMESLSKELEELSFQHTQKCLENSKLRAEVQFERKSVWKQRESPEMKPEQVRASKCGIYVFCSPVGGEI